MTEENKYYVYVYKDPKSLQPFYIGKGTGSRYKQHLTDKFHYCPNKRLNRKINKLRKKNLEPVIDFYQTDLDEETAYQLETKLIQEYGRRGYEKDGILLNHLIDGRPPKFQGEEHPWFGRKHSEDSKKKMSLSKKGKQLWLGKTHSEDTKRKMSESKKGKKPTKAIEASIKARLGKPTSQVQKEAARNSRAKTWEVTYPDGRIEIVFSLLRFCKEHGLQETNLRRTGMGILQQHKGFKCRKLS